MKNDGRSRKRKTETVECQICHEKIELLEENIEHIEGIRFIQCENCGNDIILRK